MQASFKKCGRRDGEERLHLWGSWVVHMQNDVSQNDVTFEIEWKTSISTIFEILNIPMKAGY